MICLENVWKLFPLVGDFYVLRTLLHTTSVKIGSKMLFSGIIFSKISGNFKFIGIGFIRVLFIYLIFFLFCLWRWTQLHTIGFKTYLNRIYIIALLGPILTWSSFFALLMRMRSSIFDDANIYGSAISDPPKPRPYDHNNKGYFRLFFLTSNKPCFNYDGEGAWTLAHFSLTSQNHPYLK